MRLQFLFLLFGGNSKDILVLLGFGSGQKSFPPVPGILWRRFPQVSMEGFFSFFPIPSVLLDFDFFSFGLIEEELG